MDDQMTYVQKLLADKRFPPLKKRESHEQKIQRLCHLIRHMALISKYSRTTEDLEAYLILRKEVLGF